MKAAKLLEASLEMLILRALRNGSMDAYAIIHELQEGAGEPLLIEIATLHPILYRLEARSLIVADWRPGTSGTRSMHYSLTPQGEVRLGEEEAEWHQFASFMTRILEHRTPVHWT